MHKVKLSLPKFKIESELSLKEAIMRMGYSEMFSDKADFSRMTSSKRIKIDNILHKTLIEIDEEKTKAAALTEVYLLLIGEPRKVEFNANHPFLFFIMDNRTKAILFMGRYVK